MEPKPASKPREYKDFAIEVGHSGSAVMPRAAWARNKQGNVIKALGQTDAEAYENVAREIDKFLHSTRCG